MDSPLVSVGLPTRNRVDLLPRALEALLGQTYKNIEFIVSDNASVDGTEEVVRSFAARDPRISYMRQERDINGAENHEYVLGAARGKYFMWASDDDWWDSRFVDTLVQVLEKNPDYGVAMSYYRKRFINDANPRTELVTHNFTHLGHADLFRKYFRGNVTPIFFFGLYRTDFLKKVFRRKTPSCMRGLMLTLAEIALATRSYSVPEFLHEQSQDGRIHIVRHPNHPYTAGELDPFAMTRFVFKTPWWLFTSSAIPLRRKLLMLPFWCMGAQFYRKKIAAELWRFLKFLAVPINQKRFHIEELFDRWLTTVNYVELRNILFLLRRMAKAERKEILASLWMRKQKLTGDAAARLEYLEIELRRAWKLRA